MYNSEEKRARILTKSQFMKLSKAVSDDPKESELEVVCKFVAKLMSLPKQFDIMYHSDQFLRDQLLTAVYIP